MKNRRRKKETTARSIRLSIGISDCRFRVARFVKTVCALPADRWRYLKKVAVFLISMHSESFESFQRLRILSKHLVIWNFIVIEKDGNKWMIRQESVDKCFSKKAILGRCDVLPVSTHPFFKANRGQTGERAKKRRGTKGRVIDSRNGG